MKNKDSHTIAALQEQERVDARRKDRRRGKPAPSCLRDYQEIKKERRRQLDMLEGRTPRL